MTEDITNANKILVYEYDTSLGEWVKKENYGGSDNPLKTGGVFEEMYTESDLDENDQITFEEDMSECEVVNMDDGDGLDFSVGDKDVSLEAKNVDTNGLPNLYHINETFPAFTVVDFSDTTTPTFIMIVRK